jgi:hypothetical protein
MNTKEQQTRQIAPGSPRREGERAGSSRSPGAGAAGWHLDVTRRREHTDAVYEEVEAVHDAIVPQKQIAAWQVLNPSLVNMSSLKSTELKDSSAEERSIIETKK